MINNCKRETITKHYLQEFYEVSEAMADMTDVEDAEQGYDGQWYKV